MINKGWSPSLRIVPVLPACIIHVPSSPLFKAEEILALRLSVFKSAIYNEIRRKYAGSFEERFTECT
jgi:hypothetical protein